jgi:hypothetical protein
MDRRSLVSLLPFIAFGRLAGAAEAPIEAGGAKFERSAELGGQQLKLNGAGVRYWLVLKVYAVGLYTVKPVQTSEQALSTDSPKRIAITTLRDVSGEDFARRFSKALRDGAKREELAASIPGIIKLGQLFAAQRALRAGDTVLLDYLPNQGTMIRINAQSVVEPIKEPEFYRSVLRTLVGESPIDVRLRDALLGQKSS